MKKFKSIAVIIVLSGLVFFAYQLNTKNNNSKLSDEALSDFAIRDTASIDKLIITDTEGNAGITLLRTPNGWTNEKNQCIQQHLVITILHTIKHVKVKSLVPQDAIQNINKSLTAHHKKVEIYQDGKISKTWYIGNATADHYGTYMLLKDPVKGKSPEPFITHVPSEYGSLESRFIANPLEYECSGIFNYDPLAIKSIDVKIHQTPEMNFKIVANSENNFSLFNNEKNIETFDTTKVRSYILFYKKIHFESHNSILNPQQVDSLKKTVPYYTIAVTTKEGDVNKIDTYKKGFSGIRYDLEGNLIEFDQDRLWVVTRDGKLVVGQYHVFDKLLRDIDYFIKDVGIYF